MGKNSKSNTEDLLGSDGTEWLEEVTQKLVPTPTKPRVRPTRLESIGKSKTNANKTPIAIDLRSQSGASQHLRASKPPNHPSSLDGRTPTRSPFRSSHVPTMEPTLVWISSEEDAGDTESDTDSFSIFDQGSELSQQTTMGSISSLTPESPTKVTLRPSSGLLSTREHAASHPIVTDNFTLSPSQLLNNTPMSPSDEDFFACSATISSPSERLPPPIPSVNSPPIPGYVPSPMPDSPHYFVIAHDKETQKLFDDLTGPVSWGAQYELARGVSLKEWTWEDVRKKVHHFAGKSDAEAMHLVCYIMKNVTLPKFLKNDIGQESDREQFAILENCNRGLGLMGHLHGVDDWFGGQIQQTATLRESARRTLFLQLEPLEMRRSTRFARQFGSRRIIMVRIPDELLLDRARQHTISFLSRKFVLNGRIYAPTPPKEHAVYLVEINEDYERTAVRKFGDQHRMSLREVLEWHNPMALNSQQPVSKYAARAALALSNSVPSLIFNVEDIQFIDDIIASDCTEKKPPASKVLTDGCGFMNEAALKAIATALNYASRPTAVQGRIAGSKGLWTIHPDKNVNSSDVPQIWIRESQRKIVYPDLDSSRKHYKSLDRVHRIFDLCHAALPTPSTAGSMVSLSKHSVLNLWANGVPIEIFKELMEKGLQETIEPLIQWDGQFAMPALWDAINKAGKISHMRTARLGAGMARALGLAGRDYSKEGSTQSEAGASPIFSSTVTGRNEMSGAPVALQETAIELVQAGFHPAKDFMLWSTLQKVLEVTVQGAIDKCSIPLPEGSAATAFVIPDPLGVLDENEIYYRSSTPIRNPHTRTLFHVITGEMLIFRYPLRVSSDTQKVNAVDKPELAPWSDVFIVPIKPSDSGQGLLSMMSKCSGGDQDGDDLCGIWLDCLVKSFKVSPLVLEPKDISSNFERKVEKVDDFLTRLKSVADAEPKLISTFLEGLTNFNVGLYNEFHDKAVRHNGYDSAAAIRLAFLFNRLLDAPKTGAMLHSTVLREDSAQNRTFKESLECRERSGLQKSFIFDELGTFGQGLLKTTMAKFEQLPTSSEKSHILLEPYRMAQNLCRIGGIPTGPAEKIAQASGLDSGNVMRILQEARRLDLRLIEQHVDQAFHKFCFIVDTTKGLQEKKKKKKGKSTQPDTMGPVIALYTQEIHGLTNTLPNIDQVKASYAYSKSKTHNFGKTVAFRTLCEIQVAASSEGGAPCSRLLDQVKSVSGGARRLF